MVNFRLVAEKILHKYDAGRLITGADYPRHMTLTSDIWGKVRQLRDYSDRGSRAMAQKYRNHTGSLGYEHAAIVVLIDGKLYLSNTTTGSWTDVRSTARLQIKYEQRQGYIEQQRVLNGRVIDSVRYSPDKLPSQLHYGFVLHIHTHPQHWDHDSNGPRYNFWSATDFNSIASSQIHMHALITDRVWLVGKTSKYRAPGNDLVYELGRLHAKVDHSALHQLIREQLASHGMMMYTSKFGYKLEKV